MTSPPNWRDWRLIYGLHIENELIYLLSLVALLLNQFPFLKSEEVEHMHQSQLWVQRAKRLLPKLSYTHFGSLTQPGFVKIRGRYRVAVAPIQIERPCHETAKEPFVMVVFLAIFPIPDVESVIMMAQGWRFAFITREHKWVRAGHGERSGFCVVAAFRQGQKSAKGQLPIVPQDCSQTAPPQTLPARGHVKPSG
ncbi:hypothetical protein BV22DRAFT_1051172 [Leucogyrophana mollusca]|uniref:Uncharacterized protein n=1 Tax=Leucogyrophana mollusca TaxID=85980 RepID=A0ACB8B0N6_9AGAM|nr:hypothetical protein BV22DRAFT_1051172 [Leucogyrophana mollusca]